VIEYETDTQQPDAVRSGVVPKSGAVAAKADACGLEEGGPIQEIAHAKAVWRHPPNLGRPIPKAIGNSGKAPDAGPESAPGANLSITRTVIFTLPFANMRSMGDAASALAAKDGSRLHLTRRLEGTRGAYPPEELPGLVAGLRRSRRTMCLTSSSCPPSHPDTTRACGTKTTMGLPRAPEEARRKQPPVARGLPEPGACRQPP
jgi:hypothetical protein